MVFPLKLFVEHVLEDAMKYSANSFGVPIAVNSGVSLEAYSTIDPFSSQNGFSTQKFGQSYWA